MWPILLLDDLFDKLDAGRVEQLIRLVSDETFGQILISDCNPTRLKTILDRTGGDYALFAVADGSVTQERMTARQTAEEELRKQETASAAAEPQNPEPESDPRPTEPDDKNAEA